MSLCLHCQVKPRKGNSMFCTPRCMDKAERKKYVHIQNLDYAGMVDCLKCGHAFLSPDKRKVRFHERCRLMVHRENIAELWEEA